MQIDNNLQQDSNICLYKAIDNIWLTLRWFFLNFRKSLHHSAVKHGVFKTNNKRW